MTLLLKPITILNVRVRSRAIGQSRDTKRSVRYRNAVRSTGITAGDDERFECAPRKHDNRIDIDFLVRPMYVLISTRQLYESLLKIRSFGVYGLELRFLSPRASSAQLL